MSSRRLSRNYVALLVLGGLLAVLGGSCEAIGIGMAVAPSKGVAPGVGLFWMGFSVVVFVVPAGLMLFFGLRARTRVQRLEKLAALGAASVRLPIDLVATELHVAPAEARQLILDAVGDGLLRGRLDLEQGVFFSASAETTFQQGAVHCRRCGANATVVFVPGERPTCPYCQSPV